MRGFLAKLAVPALGALSTVGLSLGVVACGDVPVDDYENFQDRTAYTRPDAGADSGPLRSQREDLTGRWLLNALLFGGIEVGLRIVFVPQADDTDTPPSRYDARVWLWTQADDAEPLVVTTTEVDAEGRFLLVADPLNLPGAVLNRVDPIEAIVNMASRTLSAGLWCGVADGEVTRPLTLDLTGNTFAALRDDNDAARLVLDDVPFRCPDEPDVVPDMGVGGDMGTIERPASPDLSDVTSVARDLTGDWLFTADFAIPLQLWISLRSIPGPDGVASLDGALRSVRATPGEPALATFTTAVDADGRFEIWLPDFALSVGALEIKADILLAAASLEDGFCGEAAGGLRSPAALAQDLAGTAYRVVPFTPGEAPMAGAPNRCPGR